MQFLLKLSFPHFAIDMLSKHIINWNVAQAIRNNKVVSNALRPLKFKTHKSLFHHCRFLRCKDFTDHLNIPNLRNILIIDLGASITSVSIWPVHDCIAYAHKKKKQNKIQKYIMPLTKTDISSTEKVDMKSFFVSFFGLVIEEKLV